MLYSFCSFAVFMLNKLSSNSVGKKTNRLLIMLYIVFDFTDFTEILSFISEEWRSALHLHNYEML